MPTVEITTHAIVPEERQSVAADLTEAITKLGIPKEHVTIVFRPVDAAFDGGKLVASTDFASVDITIPRREEPFKRSLVKAIAASLVAAGIREDTLKIVFRHITVQDVAVGNGTFPFWPE